MDLDALEKQIAHLNLAVFGHRQGAAAAAAAAGAANANGRPLTAEDLEKLLAASRGRQESPPGDGDLRARVERLEQMLGDLKEELAAGGAAQQRAGDFVDAQGDPVPPPA